MSLGRKVNRARLENPDQKDLVVNVVRRALVENVARRAGPVRKVRKASVARLVSRVPREIAVRPVRKVLRV